MLLTDAGEYWPYEPTTLARLIETFKTDGRYEQQTDGPLYVFVKRQ